MSQMSFKSLLDFGSVSVFDAAVNTCIVILTRHVPLPQHTFQVATLRVESNDFNMRQVFQKQAFSMQCSEFSSEGWTFASPMALKLIEKLQNTGTQLGQLQLNPLYSGIYTVNEYIIDVSTRNRLIAEDPNCNHIIKPTLRGRDTQKWKVEWAELYIIMLKSSANKEWPWSDAINETEAEHIFAETYPSIYNYLQRFRERLINRSVQGRFFWELGACAYYTELEKPKIIYPDTAKSLYVCYDKTGIINLNSTWLIPTEDLSLLAILSSKIFDWYARHKFQSLDDPWAAGRLIYKKVYMDKVPIADRTSAQKAELAGLVEQILDDPESDEVPVLEKEIDTLVYRLYGLSANEIALIEQTYRDAGMDV